jgi:hypothetical protein
MSSPPNEWDAPAASNTERESVFDLVQRKLPPDWARIEQGDEVVVYEGVEYFPEIEFDNRRRSDRWKLDAWLKSLGYTGIITYTCEHCHHHFGSDTRVKEKDKYFCPCCGGEQERFVYVVAPRM